MKLKVTLGAALIAAIAVGWYSFERNVEPQLQPDRKQSASIKSPVKVPTASTRKQPSAKTPANLPPPYDFEGKLRWLSSLPVTTEQDISPDLRRFVAVYFKKDPEAAIAWVMERGGVGFFEYASIELGRQLALAGDVNRVYELFELKGGRKILDGGVEGLATNSPSDALTLAAVGQSTESYNYVLAISIQSGKVDEAIAAARTHLTPREANGSIAYLYAEWARTAPQNAAEHLIKQPSSRAKHAALKDVSRVWLQQSPRDFEAWLKKQPRNIQDVFDDAILREFRL